MTYTPTFKCKYCGQLKSADVFSAEEGLFVPCQCSGSRAAEEQAQRVQYELRKRSRQKK